MQKKYDHIRSELINDVKSIKCDFDEDLAMRMFRFQYEYCKVYQDFVNHLGIRPEKINSIDDIPFLPVSAFKNHRIKTGAWQEEVIFLSSSTTGQIPSKHYCSSKDQYLQNTVFCFEHFFGQLNDLVILALMPSYLERQGSSLISMVEYWLTITDERGGFYLYEHQQLYEQIHAINDKTILLFGVSFALLDFADKYTLNVDNLMVMETGGMKGRRKEMAKSDLHQTLQSRLGVDRIFSEYGMTELMSQAYSMGNNIFETPPPMKIIIKEITDPLSNEKPGRTGLINVIDLANIDTCAFIATEDLGRINHKNEFEIMGRADHSEIRGCNLMVSDFS